MTVVWRVHDTPAKMTSFIGLLPYTKNCGCACAENAGDVFPVTVGKRSRHASRHVRNARAVCMPGSLTSGFLWNRRRRKTFPAFPRMRKLQFYVSGKRPIVASLTLGVVHHCLWSNHDKIWLNASRESSWNGQHHPIQLDFILNSRLRYQLLLLMALIIHPTKFSGK